MTLLENINRDSFQRFQLRAGLNQVWKLNLATIVQLQKKNFSSLSETLYLGMRGGWSGRRTKTTIWYMGEHSQCSQQNGIHGSHGKNTGDYGYTNGSKNTKTAIHTGAKPNFISRNYQEFDTWKMWIWGKMRLWKCEFDEKWDFENVNLIDNVILKIANLMENEILRMWIW